MPRQVRPCARPRPTGDECIDAHPARAPTATLIPDGRVLAVGGWSDSSTPSASTDVLELYDPAADRWTTLPVRLARPRHDHAAVRLPDCRVAVVGGQQVEGSGAPVAPREVELIVVPED